MPENLSQKFLSDAAWPQVNIYPNAEAYMVYYTYDDITKELVHFKDMSGTQYINADGNRARLDLSVTDEKAGSFHISQVYDFTKNEFVEYIPEFNLCRSYPIPLKAPVNLKDLIAKITSPTGGMTTYEGVETPAWSTSNEQDYVFEVDYSNLFPENETMYFTQDGSAKWFEVEDQHIGHLVLETPNGFTVKTFTDADFVIEGCTNPTPSTDASAHMMRSLLF